MEAESFWNDARRAAEVSQKAAELKGEIDTWISLKEEVWSLIELLNEASGKDGAFVAEIEKNYQTIKERYQEIEFFTLFSGKFDRESAIFAIHAGTGGVDAQDWSDMLLRMYLKFFSRRGFDATILDKQPGKEAGIKSVTLEVLGAYAYGWTKGEAGVHRLVRISPFDAEKMRHTSFALVEVIPDRGERGEVEIQQDDLRVDTFRSSGPGGQSVNTTDSAVRIVHIPTKISVACQSERSQYQNKERALKILKAKLRAREEENREKAEKELRGEYHEAKWGSQIRSYILQPYTLVKDTRTGYETSRVDEVLNGEIEPFVESFLKKYKLNHPLK